MAYKMHKEMREDLKDIFHSKSPREMKRFKTPEWYVDPRKVKKLRRKLIVSQVAFANGLGTSVQIVRHWEKTGIIPSFPRKVLALLLEDPGLFSKMKRA